MDSEREILQALRDLKTGVTDLSLRTEKAELALRTDLKELRADIADLKELTLTLKRSSDALWRYLLSLEHAIKQEFAELGKQITSIDERVKRLELAVVRHEDSIYRISHELHRMRS